MSFELDAGSRPKEMSANAFSGCILVHHPKFGQIRISMIDLLCLTEYALTNADLFEDPEDDPRLAFVRHVGRMYLGEGLSAGRRKLHPAWINDQSFLRATREYRKSIAKAMEEVEQTDSTTRPSFLQLASALWEAEDELEFRRIRSAVIREFGRRLEGTASIHDLANYVAFPADVPNGQRLERIKATLERLAVDGLVLRVQDGDRREYGEYDVPYELA